MNVTVECGREWNVTIDDLLAVGKGLSERRGLLRDLGTLQVQQIDRRVDRREGIGGGTYTASKRAQRDGGQTLKDRGKMMGNLGARNLTADGIEVGWSSELERRKALWAQEGTRAHRVAPVNGKALRFRVGAGRGKGAFAFSKGHTVPGTPPRPFFGVSRSDNIGLMDRAEKWRDDILKARGF